MFLYTNGCSFTWGHELVEILENDTWKHEDTMRFNDVLQTRPPIHKKFNPVSYLLSNDDDYRLKYSWSGILSNYLNCEGFENDAFPGGSNDRIIRTTMDWILMNKEKYEEIFVVIGWTQYNRIEFWDTDINGYACFSTQFHHQSKSKETLDFLSERKNFLEAYWKRTFNQYEKIYTFLQQLLFLQSFLRDNNINFLFFNAFVDFDAYPDIDFSKFEYLISQVDQERYLHLKDDNFNNWANKYPKGPMGHPLEQGHAEWAKYLKTQIDKRNLL